MTQWDSNLNTTLLIFLLAVDQENMWHGEIIIQFYTRGPNKDILNRAHAYIVNLKNQPHLTSILYSALRGGLLPFHRFGPLISTLRLLPFGTGCLVTGKNAYFVPLDVSSHPSIAPPVVVRYSGTGACPSSTYPQQLSIRPLLPTR